MAEKSVNITLESLFDLLRREKSREDLQQLPATFYHDLTFYMNEKKAMLESQQKSLDLFSELDKEKASIQFNNIKKMARELYEKRERKIITMALIKSKTNGIIIDTTAMLDEERIFYDELVYILNRFRQDIVLNLLEGNLPKIRSVFERSGISSQETEKILSALQQKDLPIEKTSSITPELSANDLVQEQSGQLTAEQPFQSAEKLVTQTRMVRFLNPVPKFVGEELEVYGPFEEDDIANLPEKIAEVLIKKGRAEEISEG